MSLKDLSQHMRWICIDFLKSLVSHFFRFNPSALTQRRGDLPQSRSSFKPYINAVQLRKPYHAKVIRSRLRSCINEHYLSQEVFRKEVGISQSYLSELETGKKGLTEELYNNIVERFGRNTIIPFIETESDNIANNTPHLEWNDKNAIPLFELEAASCGMPTGFEIAIEANKCDRYIIPDLVGCDFTIRTNGRSSMNFNQYTWNLYKQSPIGQKAIKEFEEADGYTLLQKHTPYYARFIPEGLYNDWLETMYCYGISGCDIPASLDEAKGFYEALITLGIMENEKTWIPHNDFKNMLGFIQPISYLLSGFASNFFFPYLFVCRIFD